MAPVKTKDAGTREGFATADRLHSAAIHLLRRLRVRDRESGVGPAQLSALSVLVFGGPRSLGERAGLVRRRATEDGRRVRLEASAKGTKVLQEGRMRRVESLAKALCALSGKEQKLLGRLVELLQRVIRNL